MKRGQSISINTIIVASIALLVLVLIVMIFTTNIGNWRQNADSCENNGGSCVDTRDECSADYETIRNYPCYTGGESDGRFCCVRT